jgi:hypothetical protein
MDAPKAWSRETTETMTAAGWHSGRRVDDHVTRWRQSLAADGGFVMSDVAERILFEFGGLRVEQSGSGKECAREAFEMNPELAQGESSRFARFESRVAGGLFPLGEAVGGHAFLAVDALGRVYLVADDILFLASDIYEGIEALVQGLRPSPVARGGEIQG